MATSYSLYFLYYVTLNPHLVVRTSTFLNITHRYTVLVLK